MGLGLGLPSRGQIGDLGSRCVPVDGCNRPLLVLAETIRKRGTPGPIVVSNVIAIQTRKIGRKEDGAVVWETDLVDARGAGGGEDEVNRQEGTLYTFRRVRPVRRHGHGSRLNGVHSAGEPKVSMDNALLCISRGRYCLEVGYTSRREEPSLHRVGIDGVAMLGFGRPINRKRQRAPGPGGKQLASENTWYQPKQVRVLERLYRLARTNPFLEVPAMVHG